jgi:hypothetical protein
MVLSDVKYLFGRAIKQLSSGFENATFCCTWLQKVALCSSFNFVVTVLCFRKNQESRSISTTAFDVFYTLYKGHLPQRMAFENAAFCICVFAKFQGHLSGACRVD